MQLVIVFESTLFQDVLYLVSVDFKVIAQIVKATIEVTKLEVYPAHQHCRIFGKVVHLFKIF